MSKEWNVSHCWPFCSFSLHLYRCSTQEPNSEPLAGSVQTEQKVLAPVPEPGWCGGRLVKHETTLGWTVLMRVAVSDLNTTTFTSDFWNTQKYIYICSFRLDSTCQANLISQALFCFGFVVLCIFFTKKRHFPIKLLWIYSRMLPKDFLFKFLKNTQPQFLNATWVLMAEGDYFLSQFILEKKWHLMWFSGLNVIARGKHWTNLEQISYFFSCSYGFLVHQSETSFA